MKNAQVKTLETQVGVEPKEVNKLLLSGWLILSHSVLDNEPRVVWVLIKPEKEEKREAK